VCDKPGRAEAVLIRALEPIHGVDVMRGRRGVRADRALCSGPGKLCQALGVTRDHDGRPLDEPPFELLRRDAIPPIVIGRRIGITQAADLPWRYGLEGSPFLSRPFRP
jgi:DNA-3-methyladenine glycosylase